MNKLAIVVVLMFELLTVNSIGYAQTDFDIKSSRADIEKEYRQELDQWILRAYEGDRDAQFKVGVLFTNQQFNDPDYEQAVYWYKQAARQGHVLAQYNLGHQYLVGLGAERSESKAMEWWLKAAEQGHALAQFNVGRGFYLGIGIKEDHKKSRLWFERAAKNGEPKSIEILQKINWSEDSKSVIASTNSAPNSAGNKVKGSLSTITTQGNDTQAEQSETQNPTKVAVANTPSDETSLQESEINEPQTSITEPEIEQATPEQGTSPTVASTAKASNQTNADATTPSATKNSVSTAPQNSIKVFTDPGVRSLVITEVDLAAEISVLQRTEEWSTVKSDKGFPVWVFGNFVSELGTGVGKITGDDVNARSEPNIIDGSIVGRLDKGETLTIVAKQNKWYRLIAPTRFVAWVKNSDLDAFANSISDRYAKQDNQSAPTSNNADSDEWLFSQSPSDYTLQLANFKTNDRASLFLQDRAANADPNLRAFKSSTEDTESAYYLYGSYTGKRDARRAKKSLKLPKAWVRSFEKLQQNRCVTWKTQLPTPKELQTYCLQ